MLRRVERKDDADDAPTAAAVIVLHDGKLLCGVRSDNDQICGPGGHIEDGEAPIQTAIRETQEEFGITPVDLMYMGTQGENGENTHCTAVFLCTTFSGTPKADGKEMHGAFFLSPEKLDEQFGDNLFPPFADSLKMPKPAQIMQTLSMDISDGCGIIRHGDFGVKGMKWYHHKSDDPNGSPDSTHLRPLKEGVLYNTYDFSDEIKEYEATYPQEERDVVRKKAATRARFRDEWESHDMDEVIHRLLKRPKIQSPTKTGKVSFISDETPLYVCYDLNADYFTVIHKNKRGQARYHGVKGEPLLNYRDENGKTHGMPKGEHMKRAHFNRRK